MTFAARAMLLVGRLTAAGMHADAHRVRLMAAQAGAFSTAFGHVDPMRGRDVAAPADSGVRLATAGTHGVTDNDRGGAVVAALAVGMR